MFACISFYIIFFIVLFICCALYLSYQPWAKWFHSVYLLNQMFFPDPLLSAFAWMQEWGGVISIVYLIPIQFTKLPCFSGWSLGFSKKTGIACIRKCIPCLISYTSYVISHCLVINVSDFGDACLIPNIKQKV